MVGNPAHGYQALAIAGGQGKLQLTAGHYGVVIEKLIEVAHAEKQQGIGIFALGRGPLAHEGRQFGRAFFRREGRQGKLRF